jgi:hypothetical protein
MTLRELAARLGLEKLSGEEGLDRPAQGGYASDLLSDVIARGEAGDVWVTLQTHRNIIAVATLKELAAIILVNGRTPDPDTLAAAHKEHVPLLGTALPAFELVGRLYQLDIRGTH